MTAFWLDFFLPASVLGPVDFWAFCRFAINCFSLVDIVIGLCSKRSVGILGGFGGEFVEDRAFSLNSRAVPGLL